MEEFTHRLALARSAHDRDDPGRSERYFRGAEHQRVLLLNGQRALCLPGSQPALDLREAANLGTDVTDPIYLGLIDNSGAEPSEVFAASVDDVTAEEIEPDNARWLELRAVATQLSDLDVGLFTQALAIHNFHRAHRYSPADGAPMQRSRAGWVLASERSATRTFPRTDPAVIVGVVDRTGRILLGANARWQPKRYSAFAGFVEPGESLEDAARREVWEEAGARITNLRYLGSQPWPFPASLMVAYLAELHPDQDPESVRCDGDEIIEVRWFTRDELREVIDILPGREAIARIILEEWFGGPLAKAAP